MNERNVMRVIRLVLLAVAGLLAAELVARLLPGFPGAPEPDLVVASQDWAVPLEADRERGWKMSAGGGASGIPISSLGLRGPEADRPKILCVGDSVTFGMGVRLGGAWPEQLATELGDEVLNAGVPGYSSVQGRELLRDLLDRFEPTHVVLAFGLEDARATPLADHWAVGSAGRHVSGLRLLGLLRRRGGIRRLGELVELREELRSKFPPGTEAEGMVVSDLDRRMGELVSRGEARVSLARFRESLLAMIDMVEAAGAKPVVLGAQLGVDTRQTDLMTGRFAESVRVYREEARDVAREEGVAYVAVPVLTERATASRSRFYLSRALRRDERDGYVAMALPQQRQYGMGLSFAENAVFDPVHPSAAGHRRLALAIATVIRMTPGDE